MLKKGRADAVLDYKKDINLLWVPLQLDKDFVRIEDVILENVYPGFAADRPDLKEHYEKAFLRLYESGKIREMMLKHKISEARIPTIETEKKSTSPNIEGLKK